VKDQSSRQRENSLAEKIKDVPYMPGMGWRIMDVIDPDNELWKFYEAIEMKDGIDNISFNIAKENQNNPH